MGAQKEKRAFGSCTISGMRAYHQSLKAVSVLVLLFASCTPQERQSVPVQQSAAAIEAGLREQLGDNDWRVRLEAVRELDSRQLLDELSPCIEVIVELLESDIDEAKQPAADTLNNLLSYGRTPQSPVPELEATIKPLSEIILSSDPAETRRWALIALTPVAINLGSDAIGRVVPVFAKAAADSEEDVREWAMDGLGEFGPESKSAVPVVLQRLSDKALCSTAVKTLGRIHSEPQVCVPALLKVLENTAQDRNGSQRFPIESNVARAIAQFGPQAHQAVAALVPLVSESHSKICCSAVFALANIGVSSPEVLNALEKSYRSRSRESSRDRIAIIGALSVLGTEGKTRAEKLIQGLESFSIDGVGYLLINPAETLEVISRVPSVTALHLASSKLADNELAPLAKMLQLESLVLPETTSDAGLLHVAGLTNLRSLIHQSTYSGNHTQSVTDAGVARLSNLSNLQELSLWSSLEEDGLKHLSNLKQLRKLWLFHSVSDHAMEHLPELPLLEDVHISGTQFTDAGIGALSACQSLRILNLRATNVSDASVKMLAENHAGLVELNLWHTKITGDSVNDLGTFKRLKKLGIGNTPLVNRDYARIGELSKMLPNCEIVSLD